MVAHDRLTRALRQRCDDECPHAESIELWQMAQQLLGAFAEDLTFLRTTAAHADSTEEGAEQRRTDSRWLAVNGIRPKKA
jgi:hypothetical protein